MKLVGGTVMLLSTILVTSSARAQGDADVIAARAVVHNCGNLASAGSSVAVQQEWRQRFGLACDQGSVLSAMRSAEVSWQPQPGVLVALTSDEQALLANQETIRQAMSARDFATFAQSIPGYAGTYLDRASGGIATVLVTGDPASAWHRLAARFPYPNYLSVRKAEVSLDSLTVLQRRIADDIPTLAKQGIHVVVLDLDVARNGVVIRVTDNPATVTPLLLARYGPHVRVEFGNGIVDDRMTSRAAVP